VLADLRDSPFPKHKLHLNSYLRGPHGRDIADAAAVAVGVRVTELLAGLDGPSPLELWLPIALDRARWGGSDSMVVIGSARPRSQVLRTSLALRGYRTSGEVVSVPVQERNPFAILAIYPAEQSFGADPEAALRAAGRKMGRTVSTREAEFGVQYVDPCATDPYLCDPSCTPEWTAQCPYGPPPAPAEGVAVPSGYDRHSCFVSSDPSQDADNDGINDQCEYEVANTFRPFLAVSPNDDNLEREPYWAVAKVRNPQSGYEKHLRIFYALSYHEDGGSPSGGFKAHHGDSEFIIIQVVPPSEPGGRWLLFRATLSAHWGALTDATQTVEDWWLTYPEGTPRARPLVWVAEDKHANYDSWISCDEGAYYWDNCDGNYYNTYNSYFTVEVLPNANLGDGYSGYLTYCAYSRKGRPGRECFWDWSNFYGWTERSGDWAGPYAEALWAFGF
jgi:hypothetical protein